MLQSLSFFAELTGKDRETIKAPMENSLNGCTATGLQLVQRLNRLVGGLLANDIPAVVGKRISAALDSADARMARKAALERATAILDGGEGLSRWAIAQSLESALVRFGGVPYRRVKAGHREPDELEKCLLVLVEMNGPESAGKLWWELRAFDLPRVADEAG